MSKPGRSHHGSLVSPSLPEGWERVSLGTVVPKAEYGISTSLDTEGTLPVLRMNNLAGGEAELSDLKFTNLPVPAELLLKPDDVLFNRTNSMEHVGRTGIWRGQIGRASFASYLVRLMPDRKQLTPAFLNKWLNFPPTQTKVRRWATPAVQQVNINPTNLRKTLIDLPPVDEQVRITEVLDTMDEAIRETEIEIKKLAMIVDGQTSFLLSVGLDAMGRRRDPVQQPQLFQMTRLGLLPKSWVVVRVSQVARQEPGSTVIGPFGSNLVASDYRHDGVPVVFVRDIRETGFNWCSDVFLDARKASELSAHQVQAGDIVITKMGLPPCVASIYPAWMPSGIITADVIRLRPNRDLAEPEWVVRFLNSQMVRRQVGWITGGVTRPKVTLKDFRSLFVAIPPMEEQQRIISALAATVARVEAENLVLHRLRQLKSGFTSDLLTGRVRTHPR